MGCDIHFFVEKKNEKGQWESVDVWEKDEYVENSYEEKLLSVPFGKGFYEGRNYNLFGLLAGVRRWDIEPPIPPRGMPEDASPNVKAISDWFGRDGHSHSYMTLAELLDLGWEKGQCEDSGFVDENTYVEWQESLENEIFMKAPSTYCGDVNGPNIFKVSEEQYSLLIQLESEGKIDWKGARPKIYVYSEWATSNAEMASYFYNETLPRMKEIDPDPNNVRAVFFFDS